MPDKRHQAAETLNRYLIECGIVQPDDKIRALNRQYAISWLHILRQAGHASDLTMWDIELGREALIDWLSA